MSQKCVLCIDHYFYIIIFCRHGPGPHDPCLNLALDARNWDTHQQVSGFKDDIKGYHPKSYT